MEDRVIRDENEKSLKTERTLKQICCKSFDDTHTYTKKVHSDQIKLLMFDLEIKMNKLKDKKCVSMSISNLTTKPHPMHGD